MATLELVIVPIHVENHWVCGVASLGRSSSGKVSEYTILDSSPEYTTSMAPTLAKDFKTAMDCYFEAVGVLCGETGQAPQPKLKTLAAFKGINDCGVCTLVSATCVLKAQDSFTPAHTPAAGDDASMPYRQLIALSLLHGQLYDVE